MEKTNNALSMARCGCGRRLAPHPRWASLKELASVAARAANSRKLHTNSIIPRPIVHRASGGLLLGWPIAAGWLIAQWSLRPLTTINRSKASERTMNNDPSSRLRASLCVRHLLRNNEQRKSSAARGSGTGCAGASPVAGRLVWSQLNKLAANDD